MTDLRSVDQTTFRDEVLRAEKPVLVDFWAQWCPPCHQIAPVLAQIATSGSLSVSPRGVSRYSTAGGTTSNTVRCTSPSASMQRSVWVSIFCEMPSMVRRNSP